MCSKVGATNLRGRARGLVGFGSSLFRLPPSRLPYSCLRPFPLALFVTGLQLRFQIEHFSIISSVSRNVLMHVQFFNAVQVLVFISASNGTTVADGPFKTA